MVIYHIYIGVGSGGGGGGGDARGHVPSQLFVANTIALSRKRNNGARGMCPPNQNAFHTPLIYLSCLYICALSLNEHLVPIGCKSSIMPHYHAMALHMHLHSALCMALHAKLQLSKTVITNHKVR